MEFYCDLCDKTIELNYKSKHLKSLTHNELDKYLQSKCKIENPDFDIDEIFKAYITRKSKQFDSYLVEYDLKFVFHKKIYPHVEVELRNSQSKLHLKKFFLDWIEFLSERRQRFSHIYEMNITFISAKRYMTYECSIKQLMQMVELNLIMKITKNSISGKCSR